jgi:hypothetical protein
MNGLTYQVGTWFALAQKLGQKRFENPEPLDWCRDLAQPVRETRANPHIVQGNRPPEKQIGTLTE